jgi:cbb3-type cytochrome c oxidase subunit III
MVMSGIPIRLMLGIFGGLVIGLASQGAPAQEAEMPEMVLGDPFAGGPIFRERCMECHGRNGRGAVPGAPDLNKKVRLNDRALLDHIVAGFQNPGALQPESPNDDLTVKQVRDVLAFLHNYYHYKTFARTGEGIYNQTCVACHGEDGKGVVPGAPDLTKERGQLTQPYETLLKHILEGFQSPGSPLAMPARGGNEALTIEDVREVLAYVHQKFHWQTFQ